MSREGEARERGYTQGKANRCQQNGGGSAQSTNCNQGPAHCGGGSGHAALPQSCCRTHSGRSPAILQYSEGWKVSLWPSRLARSPAARSAWEAGARAGRAQQQQEQERDQQTNLSIQNLSGGQSTLTQQNAMHASSAICSLRKASPRPYEAMPAHSHSAHLLYVVPVGQVLKGVGGHPGEDVAGQAEQPDAVSLIPVQQRDKVTAGGEEGRWKGGEGGGNSRWLNRGQSAEMRAAMQGVSNRHCFQLVCDPLQMCC